jgi:hypothetical protein
MSACHYGTPYPTPSPSSDTRPGKKDSWEHMRRVPPSTIKTRSPELLAVMTLRRHHGQQHGVQIDIVDDSFRRCTSR